MELLDILQIIEPVIHAFDQLDVSYYIGGSVTSSIHGIPRSTVDVDLVAALHSQHVHPLVKMLESAYYIDAEMMLEAIQCQASFNLIHLDTMLKIDIFVLKNTVYHREALHRKQKELLDEEHGLEFYLASAEDIILSKLEWFRMGGEVSETQWNDVLGVLKVQNTALDMAYLRQWAAELHLTDLLEHALKDAGINQ
jgi:hypothetical protein